MFTFNTFTGHAKCRQFSRQSDHIATDGKKRKRKTLSMAFKGTSKWNFDI
jgi:hypothetical protein